LDDSAGPLPLRLRLSAQRTLRVMGLDPAVPIAPTTDAPALLTRATELFVEQLTREAWAHAGQSGRNALLRSDVAAAVMQNEAYDFLLELLHKDDAYPYAVPFMEGSGAGRAAAGGAHGRGQSSGHAPTPLPPRPASPAVAAGAAPPTVAAPPPPAATAAAAAPLVSEQDITMEGAQ
jgi:hypothetical protein